MRTLRRFVSAAAFATLVSASALAQDAVPVATAAAPAPAAPADPAVPATPVAKKRAPAPRAVPSSSPVELGESARREKNVVEDLEDEITYRVSRARRRFERGPVAAEQKGEISRAVERGVTQIDAQRTRVDAAHAAADPDSLDHLSRVHEEVVALSKIAHAAAEQIEAVRTHDDDTEDTLSATSDEVDKISDRAEELADKLEEARDALQEKVGETDTSPDAGAPKGKHHVHIGGADDRVEFGHGVEVKKDEKVASAVSFGGSVTVEGDVSGDAVAFGGNLHVTETGHVHGDAASFGGRVVVDDGGRIDGEKIQFGAGKLGKALIPGVGDEAAPEKELSWPLKFGGRLLRAGAEFLCFFLLGMLVLLLAPKRTMVVAAAIERHPLKSGGLGVLMLVSAVPLTVLLAITVLGIPLAILLWPAMFVSGFFGYVALAVVIGRNLPTGVIPTNNALFALGAVVIVAIGMVPFLGKLAWFVMGFLALGAVLMTRFGTDKNGNGPSGPETLESAV